MIATAQERETPMKVKISLLLCLVFSLAISSTTALVGVPRGAGVARAVSVADDIPAVSVADDIQTITMTAGEAQSTIVPPSIKAACPSGRFLVSDDQRRPPDTGLVEGRDLNDPNAPVVNATFDPPADAQNYTFLTNDHDLVSLSNGDVLYLTGAGSKAPLSPKPAWFDVTYRNSFGPGARSVLLTWRSTDCGRTFQYVSEFDPARVSDGSCALPQFPRLTTPPGSADRPVFNMGGSDGQLVQVDPGTGRVYLTFQCVGYTQDTTPGISHFELTHDRLNKTLVATSGDEGSSWTLSSVIGVAAWRFGVAPLADGGLALGASNRIYPGSPQGNGSYAFDANGVPTPQGAWGWDSATFYNNQNLSVFTDAKVGLIHANIWASTVVARIPGGDKVLLAFPTTITDGPQRTGHGYRLFFFDRATGAYTEGDPILPEARNLDSFVMHLAAVAPIRSGPVLLYWYDVTGDSKTATVRGRLISSDTAQSPDFAIARSAGNERAWSIDHHPQYWYGDYWTAGGSCTPLSDALSCDYYPMWVEPDGTIRYTRVRVSGAADPPADADVAPLRYEGIWTPGSDNRPVVYGDTLADFRARNGTYYSQGYRLAQVESYPSADGSLRYNGIWTPGSDGRPVVYGWTLADLRAKNAQLCAQGYRLTWLQAYDIGGGQFRYNGIWTPGSDGRPVVYGWTLTDFRAKNADLYSKGYRLAQQQAYKLPDGSLRYDGIWMPGNDGRPIVWGWTLTDFKTKNADLYAKGYRLAQQQAYDIGGGQLRYDGIWMPGNDGRPVVWGWTLHDFRARDAAYVKAGYRLASIETVHL